MAGRLSWSEAVDVCEIHAERLSGRYWDGFDCPFCEVVQLGPYEFRLKDIGFFVRESWSRQLAGERPFSRRHWLGRQPFYSSRGRYDALLALLADLGVILDRRGRASGRMIIPPRSAMHSIKRFFGLSGLSGQSGQSGPSGQGGALIPAGGQM